MTKMTKATTELNVVENDMTSDFIMRRYELENAVTDGYTRTMEAFGVFGRTQQDEQQIIGLIVRDLIASRGFVTNKDIILRLIMQLELTKNVQEKDVLRCALERVVGATPDDEED